MNMTTEQHGLYQRIEQFAFDPEPVSYPFQHRVADENHWSVDYTARVINEYRRFAFLAICAGHPTSPSDQVDQVWHWHLLHTESYWNRFCRQTLGREIHHHPSSGGGSERGNFNAWYAQTLTSYQRFFDTSPPDDIWPTAALHMRQKPNYKRIDNNIYWLIKKPFVQDLSISIADNAEATGDNTGCGCGGCGG